MNNQHAPSARGSRPRSQRSGGGRFEPVTAHNVKGRSTTTFGVDQLPSLPQQLP